jgi:ParB-like chromosome segregation protein Spo0J
MTDKPADQVASVHELVAQFVSIGLAQYDALYVVDVKKYNRLLGRMKDVVNELRSRAGDERRALLPLLDHPNLQVRMKAAHAVLAISPALARKAFESVRDAQIFPQAMDAGMTLRALDNGTYVRS